MRDLILKEAVKQLKIGGYENLSFTTISGILDTSRANLHHHFSNKEGLALAATQLYINNNMARLNEISLRHTCDFLGFVVEIEHLFIELIRASGGKGLCVCSQLVREQGLPESLVTLSKDHFNNLISLFESQVKEAQHDGVIKSIIPPRKLAVQLWTIILGILQMSLTASDVEPYLNDMKGILTNSVSYSA